MDDTATTPTALCKCGCGEPAPIAKMTDTKRGYVKGQPRDFVRGHHLRLRPIAKHKTERFKVVDRGYETACHIWLLSLTAKGYGQEWDRDRGRMNFAHRLAYERAHGALPDGTEIDHLCSQRACVNPEHLQAVAHVINIDRARRITDDQIARIRQLRSAGWTPCDVAAEIGVSATSVARLS
jgi:hypothetical protein